LKDGCVRQIFGAVIFSIFLAGRCGAAIWNLTDAEFRSSAVRIDSIDSSGIHWAGGTAPWDDVLEIWRSAAAEPDISGKLNLCFRSGDRISGEPVAFDGDNLQWNASALGKVGFSIDSVAGIVRTGYSADDIDEPRTDDVVKLANGDSTHGIVTQMNGDGVTIQAGDATPTLPWDSISAVLFSSVPGNAGLGDRRGFRVRMTDEESFIADGVELSGKQVTVNLADMSRRLIDASQIVEIEQLNGPIGWLTSRRPVENLYKPMFSENFPARIDRTVADGRRISEKFPGFRHGIGCHSYSKLTYELSGKWAGFRTQFAVDSDSPLADVTVRIYLDDKVVYEQKDVRAGRIWDAVTIPLSRAKRLSLEVDYGANFATEGRFVWLDPAFVKKLASASTQP
jgi:hypothetical protein